MTDNHPITPPPELVRQLWNDTHGQFDWFGRAVIQAARWGADQELEACCEWLSDELADYLCERRRPNQPPNKKQRGLTALEATNLKEDDPLLYQEILNAIEALPND